MTAFSSFPTDVTPTQVFESEAARLGITPSFLHAAYSQGGLRRVTDALDSEQYADTWDYMISPVDETALRAGFQARLDTLAPDVTRIGQIVMVGAPFPLDLAADELLFHFDNVRLRTIFKRLAEEQWPVAPDCKVVQLDKMFGENFHDAKLCLPALKPNETRLAVSCYILDPNAFKTEKEDWRKSALMRNAGLVMTFGTKCEINTAHFTEAESAAPPSYNVLVDTLNSFNKDARLTKPSIEMPLSLVYRPGVVIHGELQQQWRNKGVFSGSSPITRPWSCIAGAPRYRIV